ncbi:MAG: SDR family NAD(P)-dependent oxidoreductase, partial [Pseudomonadota bacterium]
TFGRLDVLILNAGIAGEAARFEKAGPDAFADVMRINFDANIRLAHEALPHLKSSLSARIVVIGSTAGIYGVKGRAPYAASKGALIAFALTLAAELERDGIFVNVLLPYAATQMTGDAAGEGGASHFSPERIGPIAGWLASEACDATGRIMLAGGGLHRRVAATEGPARFLGAAEQDFGQHAAAIDDLDGVRTFREAESAFAAFATEAARAAKEARS